MKKRSLRMVAALAALQASTALAGGPVKVTASVDGARVLVDGIDQGLVTPAEIPELPAGSHEVVAISGCERGSATVEVKKTGRAEVFVPMKRQGGSLVIQPIPPEAHVAVDGSPLVGALGAPVAVDCGSHSVAAQYDGYQSAFATVDVGPGDHIVLPLPLQPLGLARLEVAVTPDDARLLLDGSQVSVGPFASDKVHEGPHVLKAERDGYESAMEQFVLEVGETRSFSFSLQAVPGAVATAPPVTAPEPARARRPVDKTTLAGVALGVGGLAAGVVSGLEYGRTASAHAEYSDMMHRAITDNDLSQADAAEAYFMDEVQPHRVGMTVAGVAAGVLLAGGVTLIVAF